jgi:hypothetical protein
MEQIDIITLLFIGLAILSVALGIWACIVFTRPVEIEFSDDSPGHYEDIDYCEKPFIEYFN